MKMVPNSVSGDKSFGKHNGAGTLLRESVRESFKKPASRSRNTEKACTAATLTLEYIYPFLKPPNHFSDKTFVTLLAPYKHLFAGYMPQVFIENLHFNRPEISSILDRSSHFA